METRERVQEDLKITAKIVSDRKRLGFLPGKMPKHYLRFERAVYHFARKLIPEYDGGYWDFLDLSNGGFYIRPSGDEKVTVCVIGNHFEGAVSSDAAGIIVCMFALCYMAEACEEDRLIDLYYLLRSAIKDHSEAGAIWRAID
jgi:hypothetical protein